VALLIGRLQSYANDLRATLKIGLSGYLRERNYKEGRGIERGLLSGQTGKVDTMSTLRRKVVNTMARLDAPWNDNYKFDPDVWLQLLLAMNSDEEQRAIMIERIIKKTGLLPEKVEVLMAYIVNFMANQARSN
jgi:hypothetical protein